MKIETNSDLTTYLVSTIARYVLVQAPDESTARKLGLPLLEDLYRQDGRVPPEIRISTVREATESEIDLWNWHHELIAREWGN